MKKAILLAALLACSCGRSDRQPIHDKDPFVQEVISNRPSGKEDILTKSSRFAKIHHMDLKSSTSHFGNGEYSVFLSGSRVSIFVSNVGRNELPLLTAYSNSTPNNDDKELVNNYLCMVFSECKKIEQKLR